MIDIEKNKKVNVKNLSLDFDKFLPIIEMDKQRHDLGRIIERLKSNSSFSEIKRFLKTRRQRLLEYFEQEGYVFTGIFELKRRLLIGAGNPSAFEIGFTFMRNYGVPYIPGTAIKGAFSHYIKEELDDSHELKRNFKYIFGEDVDNGENIKGHFIFLDAIPLDYEFGVDILNNHFTEYYTGENPPNDWYNPVPIEYLVIESGTFEFSIVSYDKIGKNLREDFEKEFENFLSSYGLGAKTSYSYGLFKRKHNTVSL